MGNANKMAAIHSVSLGSEVYFTLNWLARSCMPVSQT